MDTKFQVFCVFLFLMTNHYQSPHLAMANRTVLVDNNTWNNSHIAEVGKAMASREEDAVAILRQMDVDYILVIFGGLTGYASDDILIRKWWW